MLQNNREIFLFPSNLWDFKMIFSSHSPQIILKLFQYKSTKQKDCFLETIKGDRFF